MLITALGAVATGLVIVTGLPQLIRVIRSRDVGGVSVATFWIYALSGCAWFAYGVLRRDLAICVTNAFVILNGLAIIAVVKRRGVEERA